MPVGKKVTPFKFLGAAMGVIGGATSILGGIDWGGKRKAAAKAAREELEKQKKAFEGLDTSNIYADVKNQFTGMENVMEDLTINQQQAQFEAQQGAQQRANIMQNLRGAAGGSGVAALAQQMAQQGQLATQRASASIGQQEQRNITAKAREASRLQEMERRGEQSAERMRLGGAASARNLQYQKQQGLMSLAAGQAQAATQALDAGRQQVLGGISQVAGGVISGVGAGLGNIKEGKTVFGGEKPPAVSE